MVTDPGAWLRMEPVDWEVNVCPVGDAVKVEASLVFRDGDGRRVPDLSSYVGSHPSVEYVYPDSWWGRLFGTPEQRIERAKQRVSHWAEKQLAKERRALTLAAKT